jgi:hypothetical protein
MSSDEKSTSTIEQPSSQDDSDCRFYYSYKPTINATLLTIEVNEDAKLSPELSRFSQQIRESNEPLTSQEIDLYTDLLHSFLLEKCVRFRCYHPNSFK